MNENFIELNDNFGIVSDDMGNLDFISKRTNEYSFEDILSKENEIEDSNDKLLQVKHELFYNKEAKLKAATMCNFASIIPGVSCLIVALSTKIPLQTIVLGPAIAFVGFQIFKFAIIGRKSKFKEKISKLNTLANNLETNLDTLKKELDDMKTKVDYSKIYDDVLTISDKDYDSDDVLTTPNKDYDNDDVMEYIGIITIPDKDYDYDEVMEYNNYYNEVAESNQNNSKKYKIKTLKK